MLNIRISSPDGSMDEHMEIHIHDLTGRKMMSQQLSVWGSILNEQIDVSTLPGAIYLLLVETPSGTHSCKFVKTDR